jgi:hypothetical protein
MKNKKMISKYYKDLDEKFHEITQILDSFEKSQILQDYFFKQFKSFIYANMIDNFFKNLNQENVAELNLPQSKITVIEKEYETLRKNAKLTMPLFSKEEFDEKHYFDFRNDLKKQFPEFVKMLLELEKIIPIKDVKKYISKKEKEIKGFGKKSMLLEDTIKTKILEAYLNEHHEFPIDKKFDKSYKKIVIESLKSLTEELMKTLEKDKPRMLKEHRKIRDGFENRLYDRWKDAIDYLESLVVICLESGEDKKNKISKGKAITNPKHVVLVKIHARAIQIAYEILALIRSGFADGAHARWRSLHELAIISFFLRENEKDVSERYLEHDSMKKFKESKDYQKYHKKLKYPPLTKRELDLLEKEHSRLLQKYGSEFEYKSGFEWIPKSVMSNRNFRSLEEHVKMDKFHPFYSWASNAVHSGSKGFHRLGVIDKMQNKILMVGPTNYGLADPIDSTAISLSHITMNLLLLEPDLEDLLIMQTVHMYIKEIGKTAVEIQKQIEKETRE